MPDEVEKLSLRRRLVLMGLASTFLVWQIPSMDYFDRGGQSLAGSIADIGQILWVLFLVALLYMGRKLFPRAPENVQLSLEDELVKSNRQKAIHKSYYVLIIAIGVIFLISRFMDMSGRDVARLLLAIGVAAPLYIFVVLERINA